MAVVSAKEIYKQQQRDQRARRDQREHRLVSDNRNTRRPAQRQPSRTLLLTRMVMDWYFANDNQGAEILVPVFTDFYYSNRWGGKNNIQHWSEWEELGLPIQIDAIEYHGRVYRRYDRMTTQLIEQEQEIRNELYNAIVYVNAPENFPPTCPRKYKWAFFLLAAFDISIVLITLLRSIGAITW